MYNGIGSSGKNISSNFSKDVFDHITLDNSVQSKNVYGGTAKKQVLAQIARLDKKLKMVELQLKKANIDQKQGDNADTVDAEGYVVMDRNAILDKILNNDQDK